MVSIYDLLLPKEIPELKMPILIMQNVIKDHPLSLKRGKNCNFTDLHHPYEKYTSQLFLF